MLPEKIKKLDVTLDSSDAPFGALIRQSQFEFTYLKDDDQQPPVSILMPPTAMSYRDGDLFPSMDMNLPEGFLFQRLKDLFPKANLQKMHLLALAGQNGIGRIGFSLPDSQPGPKHSAISRESILESTDGDELFKDLLSAYLSTGIGISGVQPKVMVPSRVSIAIPDLIVKTEGPEFPGLAANEFLCMSAARAAGIQTADCDLSADGRILVVDRFDLGPNGHRLGFEDMAALMGFRVHDRLSDRKYQGSYEAIADVIGMMSPQPSSSLHALFEQVAFSVMVRNGDAHLKNFGLLYSSGTDAALAPMFDVVTTAIYTFERPGGIEDVDRTLALRLNRKSKSKAYPTTDDLIHFGRAICRVSDPAEVIIRIGDAMAHTLKAAHSDDRIAKSLLGKLQDAWAAGLDYAQECGSKRAR